MANYYLNRGIVYDQMHLYQSATQDYRCFKALLPDYQESLTLNFQNLVDNKQYEQAKQVQQFLKKLSDI